MACFSAHCAWHTPTPNQNSRCPAGPSSHYPQSHQYSQLFPPVSIRLAAACWPVPAGCLWPEVHQEAGGGDVDALELDGLRDSASGHDSLAGDHNSLGEDGGAVGVSQVITQVGQGVLASHLGGHDEADVGKHGQASVLDLLDLQLLQVTGHNGGEDATGVANLVVGDLVVGEQGIHVHGVGLAEVLPPLDLNEVHGPELEGQQTHNVEGQVNLGSSLVPEDVRASNLLGQDTSSSKHSPAAVHALRLGEPLQLLLVCAQTQRVEAKVSWQRAIQVGRRSPAGQPQRPAGRGLGSDHTPGRACGSDCLCGQSLGGDHGHFR
mmetsp:Transcript_38797/g.86290  ORF Transcript_38797/g.86290 Transcript_38797/m.86290 type:complete len:321 (-) Transcript_38797:95-1057(-)